MRKRRGKRATPLAAFLALAALAASRPGLSSLPKGLYAELKTSKGTILLKLEFERTQVTVANFVGLAEGTINNGALPPGTPFFDGTLFHRVVPGHVIQAGRPAGTDHEGPGYAIPNEIDPGLVHDRAGILGMANGGPHTGGSQFYITLADRSYLDGDYTVFGAVVQGMEVVSRIGQGDAIEKVTIIRIGRAARRFQADDASFRKLVERARLWVQAMEEDKKMREEAQIAREWPDAAILKPGIRSVIRAAGTGDPPSPGARLSLRFWGRLLNGRTFVSLADGKPGRGDGPSPFSFVLGNSSFIPGIDAALPLMRKGEKRLLILAPEMAFGSSGFYGKSEPGKKRFVISPNTVLVIEVELLDILQ